MCLYPKLIRNRKYVANKKNGGIIPPVNDPRVLLVPIGCQKCIECRKQKSRAWQVRLNEQIRTEKEKQFVTLTFSNESISDLTKEIKDAEGYTLDNEIATLAIRRFLERWRKQKGTSVTHWFITELGHKGTENIHLHGIIFNNDTEEIKKRWGYGYVYIGEYVNEQTVGYIVKYMTKTDPQHPQYTPKILTSKGIGNNYLNRIDAKKNKYKTDGTIETYQTRTGTKLNLPIYFRNKIYTEEEREQLWLAKLDKNERWVLGQKHKTEESYQAAVKTARKKNKRLGYGDDEKDWDKIHYENAQRQLKINERINGPKQ